MNNIPDNLIKRTSTIPEVLGSESTRRLLKIASSEDLRSELVKAGMDKEVLPGVRINIRPKHAYMLIITLGSGESFGCVTGNTHITMADGSSKAMQHVLPGDMVLSGSGVPRRVLKCFQREVSTTYKVSVEGLPYAIEMSPNHPVEMAPVDQFSCPRDKHVKVYPSLIHKRSICHRKQSKDCTLCSHLLEGIKTERIIAEDLQAGQYLMCHVPTEQGPEILSEAESELIGYWLAEGCFQLNSGNKEVRSLRFNFGIHEEHTYAARTHDLALKEGWSPSVFNYPEKSVSLVTVAGKPERTRQWFRWFGKGSHNLRIPAWMCTQPREVRLALIQAYYEGDGTISGDRGTASATTVSYDLAAGMQRLLWSVGIPATCSPLVVFGKGAWRRIYRVDYMLSKALEAGLDFEVDVKPSTKIRGFVHDGVAYLPIRDIELVDQDVAVYNMEVEVDHSYISGGVFSHNCTENGDYYPETKGKEVVFPHPIGPKSMILGDGLRERHDSFTKIGKIYRNHKTKLTHKVEPSGNIVWDQFNDRMHRGELIAELPLDKWEPELDMHERGIPLMWSQGSGVPYDVCSYAGCIYTGKPKVRGKAAPRCDHERYERLCISPDGHQNVIYCPDAVFYDMSYVGHNPAAKIAFGVMKLAESESVVTNLTDISEFSPGGIFRKAYCVGRRSPSSVLHNLEQAELDMSPALIPSIQQELLPPPEEDRDFVDTCRKIDIND